MKILETETNQSRLERIIIREIVPKLRLLTRAISDEFIESLIINSRLIKVIKGQYIEDKRSADEGRLLYLYSGIAHTFYYHPMSERQIITRIWKKHEIIFDLNSFLNGEGKKEMNQMLTDGEILSINYLNLRKLLNTFPHMVSFLLHLQAERERQYKYYQHLLRLTVEEKVKVYLNDNPALINQINNEYIAMHLGVSRSRFSKAYAAYKHRNLAHGSDAGNNHPLN